MKYETLIRNLAPVYVIALFVLLIANGVWAFVDARKRGKSGVIVAFLVLVIPFPLGPLVWVAFRPKLLHGS
jgi:hypothetical protein